MLIDIAGERSLLVQPGPTRRASAEAFEEFDIYRATSTDDRSSSTYTALRVKTFASKDRSDTRRADMEQLADWIERATGVDLLNGDDAEVFQPSVVDGCGRCRHVRATRILVLDDDLTAERICVDCARPVIFIGPEGCRRHRPVRRHRWLVVHDVSGR
ncbi:hypothetical protein HH308_28315 [Gordonia sp. TBRC 11910]|uniref:Uncharacterized protein n=1 Tax=Gordonia asplenii TaxID=2725283 RepID=A0A848LC34_9ACTN|nr:hypothetical protein [Gordonia asplenii]NMO05128.1 hypothetical protein [Gordonia asplenii]